MLTNSTQKEPCLPHLGIEQKTLTFIFVFLIFNRTTCLPAPITLHEQFWRHWHKATINYSL